MDVIDTKDVKNSATLFIIVGMLLVLLINSVDSLILRLFSVTFSVLPFIWLTIFLISFHGLIAIMLIVLLFRIVASQESERKNPTILLSLRSFRTFGLLMVAIIASSVVLNSYVKSPLDEPVDLSKVAYADPGDIIDLALVQNGVILLKNVILIIIFFVIVFKKKIAPPRAS
jgi:hypothetical protein